MNKLFIISCFLILSAIFCLMLYTPCTPPSERAWCKKEIGVLRGYLLSKDYYGISFSSDMFLSCTNGVNFAVGEFCNKVNQIAREHGQNDVFRIRQSSKGKEIVDRWGTPYNFCTIDDREMNHWEALRHCEINNVVVWSSGPNTTNEYGLNDDVALCIRPCPQVQVDETGETGKNNSGKNKHTNSIGNR